MAERLENGTKNKVLYDCGSRIGAYNIIFCHTLKFPISGCE
jgi:hypothetical protein